MDEPYPGGPGGPGGSQPYPGGSRQADQPDHWPDDYWFRPPRGQGHPDDVAAERGRRGRHRHGHGDSRRPGPDETAVDLGEMRPGLDETAEDLGEMPADLYETAMIQEAVDLREDQTAALDLLAREAGDLKAGDLLARKGSRNWAVITGTGFFVIDTLIMADGFARPVSSGSRVLVVFIWLIGVAVIALLWLRASPRFFVRSPVTWAGTRAHPGSGDPGVTR